MNERVPKTEQLLDLPDAWRSRLPRWLNFRQLAVSAFFVVLVLLFAVEHRSRAQSQAPQASLLTQSQAEADRKSTGCVTCHVSTDEPTMHPTGTVRLGCVDCHGGDATASLPAGAATDSASYQQVKNRAHPQPRNSVFSRNPEGAERVFTKWLRESYEYVRFVNPGDLRVAPQTCGTADCHAAEVLKVSTSMMTHGGMLWAAALYNNGSFPLKNARFGESYSTDGLPQSMRTVPARKKERSGIPILRKNRGVRTTSWASAASALCSAPIPCFSVCKRRAFSIRFFLCREQMTSRVIIAVAAARRAT